MKSILYSSKYVNKYIANGLPKKFQSRIWLINNNTCDREVLATIPCDRRGHSIVAACSSFVRLQLFPLKESAHMLFALENEKDSDRVKLKLLINHILDWNFLGNPFAIYLLTYLIEYKILFIH